MAGTQPHARVPSPKIRRNKLRKSIRLRAYFLSRALGPVLFTQNTRKTQKSTFPDLPNGCGPRLRATSSAWQAEKTRNLFFRSGNTTQICLNFDTTWVGGLGRTFRIVPNFPSFCLTDADLSLLSYHVSARTTFHMLAGAQRYICAFFGRLLKFESFWLFRPPKINEPHSFI